MYSMGVEAQSGFPDRNGKEKIASFRQTPGQFRRGFSGPQRVQRIPISAQADMFGDVQTTHRFQRVTVIRQP